MMSNDGVLGHDRSTLDETDDNNENEILCNACGFSSECVPEGMLTCPNCSVVYYCSEECRDWAWTGGHKNLCQAAALVSAATNSNSNASLPTLDASSKLHDSSSSTAMKHDSGKLSESFSDGSVSVASSIEPMNVFDKKTSPFFSKNKFAHFTQSSKSNTAAPKIQPLTKSTEGSSYTNSSSAQLTSNVKRGPNVTKTLGNHFNGTTPNQNPMKQLFVVSTDDDSEDDDGPNDNAGNGEGKGSMSEFDYIEDQSVGLSVLEVESVANLTSIVEESSNLMSVPVIEASWRRNSSDERNKNTDRLNYLIRKPSDDNLDMEDSEIIGTDSVVDAITMQYAQDDLSLQEQDDLVYGVKSNFHSESISSLMGNHHDDSKMLSVGSVENESENSEVEDLSYSQASASSQSNQEGEPIEVHIEQPEIVESSNSSDSADDPRRGSGAVGRGPVILGGPSLRGFRDAYNECDTASMHSMNSHSIARSLSSSEDSAGSDVDAADDLPQRMLRSSSSLKDFRDIYNADLNKGLLLREPSADSLGCSASFDYNVDKPISLDSNNMTPASTNNDNRLSTQLELIAIKSERNLQETHGEPDKQSPTRSEGTSSLQMARMRNESMKNSLNSALRVYEEMYGEDAAKEVFQQLTSTAESNVHHQNKATGDQTFEWKRTDKAIQNNRPGKDDNTKDHSLIPKSVPKYMQYRTSLSATKLDDGCTPAIKLNFQSDKGDSTDEHKNDSTSVSGSARYLQYREKLHKETSVATTSDPVRMGGNVLPKLEVDASDTLLSIDPIGANELKSNSNLSFTVNSSSDAGYQPLEDLSTKMILDTEVDIKETSAIPSKPQTEQQFSQRYLQYRKSMIKPMISGSIKSLPANIEHETKTTSSSQNSLDPLLSQNECSGTAADKTDKNRETVAPLQHPIIAVASTNTIPAPDTRPRYLSYRLSLASLDANDCSTNRDIAKGMDKLGTVSNKDPVDSLFDTTILQHHSVPPHDASGKQEVSDVQFFHGTTNEPLGAHSAIVNPDAFRSAFNGKYKQYRSSLQSVLDSENKEFIDRPSELDKDGQITEDSSIDVKSAKNEGTNESKSNGMIKPHVYQVVDLDEITVSSRTSVNMDTDNLNAKSCCGLDLIGYSGFSCSRANVESFLKIWNEMEADSISLYEERDRYKADLTTVSPPAKSPKVKPYPQLTSVYTIPDAVQNSHNSVQNVVRNNYNTVLDITMDVETGFLPSNFNDSYIDEEMKLRSKQYHKKQRYCLCFMVFVAVALPLCIGLGVSLGRSSTDFPTKSNNEILSTAAPTNIPVVAPAVVLVPTMQPKVKNVLTNSPQYTVATITPTSVPTTRFPRSSPVSKPVATTLPPSTPSPTALVSFPPTQNIEPKSREALLQIIGDVSFDNGTAIQSPGSPQFQAFSWLVSDQNSSIAYPNERIIQRYALATFYYSTDGANWSDNMGWLSDINECTWHTITSTENCDSAGIYRSIDLSANDLTGVLPNELALLSRLETLKLSGGPSRFIGGIIPSSLSAMKSLKFIDFQENFFFGAIPSELGNLSSLELLDLSMNRLSQTIPTDFGRLTLLKRLNLAVNQLTGEIPTALNSLTQLERLSVGNNNLSGQIHIGSGLGMLKELNLEKNLFSSIGSDVGFLQALQTMITYDNALIGTIPTQIVRMSKLVRLDMHGNQLTGSIPTDIGNLTMLTILDLSVNQLTNKIPSSVGSLTNLLKLHLHQNFLEGPLPTELGMLSSAFVIRINENNISGSVPEEVCENFGLNPLLYLDCLSRSDGTKEITCPPGTCCSFCCADGGGCECSHQGTAFEFLCNVK